MNREIRRLPKQQRIAAFRAWESAAGDVSDGVWLGVLAEHRLEVEDVLPEEITPSTTGANHRSPFGPGA